MNAGRRASLYLISGAVLLVFAGCSQETDSAAPAPQELTREASGFYCQMIVADHEGPKAQIFVKNRDKPLWFPSVRDAFAFLMLPSEQKNVRAIYVHDMGKATDWANPEPGTWTEGRSAFYVLGSDVKGGMGLDEVVPFSTQEAAEKFISKHGGRLSRMADVPQSYIFAPPSEALAGALSGKSNQNGSGHE